MDLLLILWIGLSFIIISNCYLKYSSPIVLYSRKMKRMLDVSKRNLLAHFFKYEKKLCSNQKPDFSLYAVLFSARYHNERQIYSTKRKFAAHSVRDDFDDDALLNTFVSKRSREKSWQGENSKTIQLRNNFFTAIRNENFSEVMHYFDAIRNSLPSKNHSVDFYKSALSACSKAEHLERALEIMAEMEFTCGRYYHRATKEPIFLPIMRCLCDKGEIDKALELLEVLFKLKEILRVRTFNPFLEAYSKAGDVSKVVDTLTEMRTRHGLIARSEQLTFLLEAIGRNKSYLHDPNQARAVNKMIEYASEELLGLEIAEMQRIIMQMNNLTLDAVADEGVLVSSLRDIRGPLVPSATPHHDGSVVAWNMSFNANLSLANAIVRSNDLSLPIGVQKENIDFVREKYFVLEEKMKLHDLKLPLLSWVNKPARLVDISIDTCKCPNCNADILPILVPDRDKTRVREALFSVAREISANQEKNLADFGDWLREREEFDYIIDGANVAYCNQNFMDGKFSYMQIETVVKKLMAKNSSNGNEPAKRILVLLPKCYAQKVIPNHTMKKRRFVKISDDDVRILDWLERENMLYCVPNGANDDWYWVYSTIYEGRKTPALVVSNDLMRDHKLAFLEPRPFIRWRSSHIIFFALTYPNFNYGNNNDSELNSNITQNAVEEPPEVYLFEPGKFSREIQYSPEVGRWHLPSTDRSVWLCLSTRSDRDAVTESNLT